MKRGTRREVEDADQNRRGKQAEKEKKLGSQRWKMCELDVQ
jgi:hypothetical protein